MAKTVAKANVWEKYKRATQERQLRMIWMASGEVGCGTTRFGLTGPRPILVQSVDQGTEGVVERILEEMGDDPNDPENGIYVETYDWDPTAEFSQETAIKLRDVIIADFEHGLKHARTILWDKETEIREIFQYAEFGSPTDGQLKDYAKLNQRYFHLMNRAKSVPGVNVGFIQGMRDEWVTGSTTGQQGQTKKTFKKTGNRIRAGYDQLDRIVLTELHFTRVNGEFGITVGKCRQNASMQDQSFPGMTLPEFGTLLIDGSEVEEWS